MLKQCVRILYIANTLLQLYEWLESRWEFEFTENDYSCHVDSIAKVQGSFKAEEYIQRIPESFRTEAVYISLLRNYVSAANVYKSEKFFYKMKDLFPLTVATCDLMLYLYKRMDWKKITNIMSFMEIEHINPSYTTYQIFIEVEGRFGSIGGMEQVFEAMKSKGMEPRLPLRASMAQYYADARLKDEAEIVLKDMEGGDLVKNRAACCFLLPVYASLGREDEVGRIWRECEASNPTRDECTAAMEAWGKLKRVKDAEAAFEKLSKILERPSTTYYSLMLNVYADNKMVTEGEDLFNRIKKLGININMKAWDALLNLYIGAGEVEKADAVLEEALQRGKRKPMYTSFLNIFEAYAVRGDVQNAEKIFFEMRKAGYVRTPRSYATLLSAYINAKAPDDGIEERMRRDGIVPGNKLTRLLAQVAAFRTSRY